MRQAVAELVEKGIGEIQASMEDISIKKVKSRVISLRVEEGLYQLIEEKAIKWEKPVAETVRNILSFYFLPQLYMGEFKRIIEERGGYPLEWFVEEEKAVAQLSKLKLNKHEALNYWKFLNELENAQSLSSAFIGIEERAMFEVAQELFKGSSEELNRIVELRKLQERAETGEAQP